VAKNWWIATYARDQKQKISGKLETRTG